MFKKLSAVAAAIFASLVLSVGVAAANGDSEAHGNVGYNAYGLQRQAKFDVEQESNKCAPWKVNGAYTFDFELSGSHYTHDATISNQNKNGNYNIAGGYPAGGPYS